MFKPLVFGSSTVFHIKQTFEQYVFTSPVLNTWFLFQRFDLCVTVEAYCALTVMWSESIILSYEHLRSSLWWMFNSQRERLRMNHQIWFPSNPHVVDTSEYVGLDCTWDYSWVYSGQMWLFSAPPPPRSYSGLVTVSDGHETLLVEQLCQKISDSLIKSQNYKKRKKSTTTTSKVLDILTMSIQSQSFSVCACQ